MLPHMQDLLWFYNRMDAMYKIFTGKVTMLMPARDVSIFYIRPTFGAPFVDSRFGTDLGDSRLEAKMMR